MVIFKFDLSHKKTKQGIVLHLPHFKKPKTWIARGRGAVAAGKKMELGLEREGLPSL